MTTKSFNPHIIADMLFEVADSPYSRASRKTFAESGKGPSQGPDPSEYDNVRTFSLDYAAYNFPRKYLGGSYDRKRLEEKALSGFLSAEGSLASFNRNFLKSFSSSPAGVGHCVEAMRRKIGEILGRFDPEAWVQRCEWGPGATSSLSSTDSTVDKKISEPRVSVTPCALPYFRWIVENDPHWVHARLGELPEGPLSLLPENFQVVESSRLAMVEKSAEELRVIDIQPTANLFLQKGVGSMIRSRLKRVGIDLDDQSRNQWLASVASRLQLCTIDLAKASDSVSCSIVSYLLPDDWFFVLNALRTRFTTYKGQTYYLNKFSAMGNGYTFELETLIFYAACCAVEEFLDCKEPIGVYGDDIIVHRDLFNGLHSVLKFLGFKVNETKSFVTGQFFESCGKHYFRGVDVTPPYQKEVVKDLISSIRCANRLFRFALRMGSNEYLETAIRRPYDSVTALASEYFEVARRGRKVKFPLIPWWLPDDFGLLSTQPFSTRNGLVRFNRLNLEPVKVPGFESALYALSLRRGCVVESPFMGLVTVRGRLRAITMGSGKTTPIVARLPYWI